MHGSPGRADGRGAASVSNPVALAKSKPGQINYASYGTGSNINHTGWYDIGGTSLSCPQWAGLVAIADQLNKASHPNELGLGLINPALYKLAASPATCNTAPTTATAASEIGRNTFQPSRINWS